jgi:hypothetical protein
MATSPINLFLSDINTYVSIVGTNKPPSGRIYKIVSRGSADKILNKDLTDTTNNLPVSAYSKFTVSNNEKKAAYSSIQAAIDAAALTGRRETVLISPGTYTEDILLRDNVHIEGSNSPFTVYSPNTILSGNVTHTLGAMSEVSITKVAFKANGKTITIGGTNEIIIDLNAVCIFSETVDPALVINNPNAVILCNNCMIRGSDVICNVISTSNITFRGCLLGDIFPMPTAPRILCAVGVMVILYSNGKVKLELSNPQTIINSSFFNSSEELAILSGGANLFMFASTFLADTPGNLLEGTGVYSDGGNAIIGRTSFAAGITTFPSGFEVNANGNYIPAIVELAGVSGSTVLTAKYARSGRSITVYFKIQCTTSDSVDPELTIALPSPRDNFINVDEAVGTGNLLGTVSGESSNLNVNSVMGSATVLISAAHTSINEISILSGSFIYDY